MNRREMLNRTLATGAVSAVLPAHGFGADEDDDPRIRIIDTNVSLFRWPFRRLPLDDVDALSAKLRSLGIDRALAGSFEALLHRDMAGVNARVADVCRSRPELIPIGSVNPTLPNWQRDLQQCTTEFNMPGIRLYPNYHGYTLDDQRFGRLIELATAAERFVQIAAAMEDVRTQHPAVRVPDVDLSPLPELMRRIRGARVQILNHRLRGGLLSALAGSPGVFFDTARVDSTDGVPVLVQSVAEGRVLFGTHAPFLVPEAALIRVHESGRLAIDQLAAVLSGNTEQAFGRLTS